MKNTIFQENKGLAKVHTVCSEMYAIWRQTIGNDLGIDGQIEFLELNKSVSTGYILAVQVKSGESYFKNEINNIIKYYANKKHRKYWERINLPVILILHHPKKDLTIYTFIKSQLQNKRPILINIKDTFSPNARNKLICAIKDFAPKKKPSEILDNFKQATLRINKQCTITGIEFLIVCINPLEGYFELRMCRITELIDIVTNEELYHIGSETYDFILRCVSNLWSSNLTIPFQSEFEEVWYDQKMVPDIAVPLTPMGLKVVKYLWSNLNKYMSSSACYNLKNSDTTAFAKLISNSSQLSSDRLDATDRLGEFPM